MCSVELVLAVCAGVSALFFAILLTLREAQWRKYNEELDDMIQSLADQLSQT